VISGEFSIPRIKLTASVVRPKKAKNSRLWKIKIILVSQRKWWRWITNRSGQQKGIHLISGPFRSLRKNRIWRISKFYFFCTLGVCVYILGGWYVQVNTMYNSFL
jgi:hypothetical protein